MNRRNFLLGSAAGGLAVAGGGAAFVKTDDYSGWVTKILHRQLPGYTFNPAGLSLFIDEFFAGAGPKAQTIRALQGLVDVKWALPQEQASLLEREERRILSQFLLGSDFFANYPPGPKEITYLGRQQGCASPFAQF